MAMAISRLLTAILLMLLCGPLFAGDYSGVFSRLLNNCAEGNFLKSYAADLRRLDLEPLDTEQATERYRFEIVPAFSKTVLIDLQVLPDGSANATAYEIPWDSEPDSALRTVNKHLSSRQTKTFQRLLIQGEFWTRYHFGWGPGLDTWGWVLEGARGTDYNVFSTSDPAPKYIEAAGTMLFRTVMEREIPR
jgi:hypothetical protein